MQRWYFLDFCPVFFNFLLYFGSFLSCIVLFFHEILYCIPVLLKKLLWEACNIVFVLCKERFVYLVFVLWCFSICWNIFKWYSWHLLEEARFLAYVLGKFHIKVGHAWNPPFQISMRFGAYVHNVKISKSTKFQGSISNSFWDIAIKSLDHSPSLLSCQRPSWKFAVVHFRF